jgi:hypothetical protein
MRVLFLDIDGVLNSTRTALAFGGYPFELEHQAAFDQAALGMIRRLCEIGDLSICLSSAWRIGRDPHDVANALDLPIMGKTGNGLGPRGKQIFDWLEQHPEVTEYAILDDDSDMLDEQLPRFVKTDGHEGLSWRDFQKLCELFKVSPYEGGPRERLWMQGKSLDWTGAP